MSNRSSLTKIYAAILVGLTSLAFNSDVFAASGAWQATATNSNWSNTTNWGGAQPNSTSESATFGVALVGGTIGGATNPIFLNTGITLQNLNFTAGAGAYVIGTAGGNAFVLRGNGAGNVPSFGNSINLAAGVTNAQVVAANISFNLPSSTDGGYAFINNSSTTAATLTLSGTIQLSTASNRVVTLSLDGSNTGNNTISGVITATGSEQGTHPLIAKNGTGTWILSGANVLPANNTTNSTSVGIQVNAGILSAQNNNALGTNAGANTLRTTVNSGGTLQLANNITLDNGVLVTLNEGATLQSSGNTTSNAGVTVATTATNVTFSTVGSADVFTIGNAANDFTGGTAGTTTVNLSGPGTVFLSQNSNYAGSWLLNSGTLKLGTTTALGTAQTVAFGASSTGALQLNGNSITLASLNTNATVGTPTITNNGAGTATLTVSNTSGTNTYGGALTNGAAGTLALTKTGAGTLKLSGANNTYSGGTTISGGVLNVTNTAGSATGTGAVALNTATLSGTGKITGTVTAASTATITPSNLTGGNFGTGILTIGNLTLAIGTNINYGLNGTATNNYINTPGTLTLPSSGGGVVLNLYTSGTNTPFAAAGVYDLFSFTTLTGTGASLASSFSFGTSISGYSASFATSGSFVQLTLTAAGATGTWTNGGATGNWNLAGNWAGTGTLPPQSAGDSATFDTTVSGAGTVNLNANRTVGGITFNNANAYTISGANTLTLDNNAGGVTVGVTTGTHSIQTSVAFNDNVNVSTSANTKLTLSGTISQATGSSVLTKTGAGTLVLSNTTNTYAGGTVISNGILNFNGIGALGSGTTLQLGGASTNGTLQYAGNTDDISTLAVTLNAGGGTIDTNGSSITFANSIGNGGAGGFTKSGTGTLILGASNSYTGATTVTGSASTLSISANNNLGAVGTGAALNLSSGGTLATTASLGLFNGAIGTNDRAITLSGSGVLSPAAATTLTVSGAITGTGQLVKTGAGQLTIITPVGGQNTYSGGTVANAGTILLGDITTAGNGLGTGAITFTGGTVNTKYYGGGGPPTLTSGGLANNLVVASGQTGTLILGGRQDMSGTLTGSGTLNLQVDYVRDSLSGNWSAFTGQINLTRGANGGDFRQTQTSGFGTAKINLGTGVSLYGINNFGAGGITMSIGELTGSGTSGVNGSGFLSGGPTPGRVLTWSVGGANTNAQFDGIIQNGTGTVAITKVGTGNWTLTGSNTYTSPTTITGGTLTIGASGTSGTLGTGTVSDNAALVFNRSDTYTLGSGNVISGTGTVTQAGSGTTVIIAGNSYSGATLVNAGTLQANVDAAMGTAAAGTTVANNAALLLNNVSYATAEALTINGSGTAGGGSLTNIGTSTFAGAITVATNSTISAGGSGNVLTLTGGISKNGTTLTLGGGGTVNVTTNGITGASANSDLIVDNSTLVLSAASTYNGPTTVQNSGIFQLGASNVLPTSPYTALTVNTSGAFDLASFSDSVGSLAGDATGTVKNSVVSTTGTMTVNTTGTTTYSGVIAGTNGGTRGDVALTKSGAGSLTLNGANSYTGATSITNGTLQVGDGTTGSINAGSAVTVGSTGTLVVNQANGTTLGNTIANNGTLNAIASGTNTLSGAISGSGVLNQNGAGTTILTASNNYTGATTVNNGTLVANASGGGALSTTSSVTVNTGGTLLLGGSNQINNAGTAVTLNGGTFNTAGNSETAGTLTLSASSIIDLASNGVVQFANSSGNAWTGTLSIYDWAGTPITGGGANQLLFGTDATGLTSTQLANISIYSDQGATFLGNGNLLGTGELVPIPEPSTIIGALAFVGLIVLRERRRFSVLLNRVRNKQ